MFHQRSASHDRAARSAYTLVELMLVLALFVVLGAMAYPELQGPIARQRLKSAAETIRGAWNNARSDAMMTGEIHLFRYEPGSGNYAVQRWINADTSSSSGPSAGSTTASDEPLSLPDEVEFLAGEQVDARAAYEAEAMSGAETGSAPSVMFYPDGSTSTVELEIANIYDTRVRISMRGLTGVVTVSAPYESGESQ
jgi:prepilin-type N-terminal cleavage/methylation domain-containing protein